MARIHNFLRSFTQKFEQGTPKIAVVTLLIFEKSYTYSDIIEDNVDDSSADNDELYLSQFRARLLDAKTAGSKMELVTFRNGLGGTCTVCFDVFEENTEVIQTTCSHYFHEKCIGLWFMKMKKKTCSTCRREI